MDQSVNQSIKQENNQTMKHTINQTTNQLTNQPIKSINQSINKSIIEDRRPNKLTKLTQPRPGTLYWLIIGLINNLVNNSSLRNSILYRHSDHSSSESQLPASCHYRL